MLIRQNTHNNSCTYYIQQLIGRTNCSYMLQELYTLLQLKQLIGHGKPQLWNSCQNKNNGFVNEYYMYILAWAKNSIEHLLYNGPT